MNAAINLHLLASAPDALIATDPEGFISLWNAAAEAIFGYSADEAIGRPLANLIFPEELRADAALICTEAKTGRSERNETLRRRKDGMPIYVNCNTSAVLDRAGRVTHYLSQMADATRYRASRDADLVHARFHGVLESAPDAVVVVNATGRIVLFNAQARALFGYDAATVIGEPIETLLPRRLRQPHVAQRTGFLGAPRMRGMGEGRELHGLRANGEEFPVEISLSPIESDAGRLVMSAIRDISERKRTERTLQEKNIALERASLAKDRFLATMSHELRTPLNAIIGFTGVMLMRLPGPLTVEQEKQLRMVEAGGKHLLSLINDLLDLAKIESGSVELQLETVPCMPVLDEVAQTLRPMAQSKGLRFEIDTTERTLEVRADRRALQQILLNLTNNALKFTNQGSVTVALRTLAEGGRRWAEFAVIDTGIGIDALDQARLFQAFTQVGMANTRKAEGSGLGLHLSYKLAELMGGRIDVASEAGRGSRFALRLEQAEP
jgi:PAS domain S-box-containing protein